MNNQLANAISSYKQDMSAQKAEREAQVDAGARSVLGSSYDGSAAARNQYEKVRKAGYTQQEIQEAVNSGIEWNQINEMVSSKAGNNSAKNYLAENGGHGKYYKAASASGSSTTKEVPSWRQPGTGFGTGSFAGNALVGSGRNQNLERAVRDLYGSDYQARIVEDIMAGRSKDETLSEASGDPAFVDYVLNYYDPIKTEYDNKNPNWSTIDYSSYGEPVEQQQTLPQQIKSELDQMEENGTGGRQQDQQYLLWKILHPSMTLEDYYRIFPNRAPKS